MPPVNAYKKKNRSRKSRHQNQNNKGSSCCHYTGNAATCTEQSMDKTEIVEHLTPLHIDPHIHYASHRILEQDWYGAPHRSGDLRFVCILNGSLLYSLHGQEQKISAGHVLFCPPDLPIHLRAHEQHTELSSFYGELIPRASWAQQDYRLHPEPQHITKLSDNHKHIGQLFQLCAHCYNTTGPYAETQMNTFAKSIILCLASNWNKHDNKQQDAGMSPRMHDMIAYIRSHLSNTLSRSTLSQEFHLSADYINQLFKRELGNSPGAIITRERCREAHRLLHSSDLSIGEISRAVGYNDPLYFSRVYKKIYRVAPSNTVNE